MAGLMNKQYQVEFQNLNEQGQEYQAFSEFFSLEEAMDYFKFLDNLGQNPQLRIIMVESS